MSAENSPPKDAAPSPEEWTGIMSNIAERSQRLVTDFVNRNAEDPANAINAGMADAINIGNAFLELTTKMMADPQRMMEAQLGLWR
ncbi:MAG: class I poly(R)-hydroxyalkanoic acid synthase, partial [Rhodospirillaceae bacterium]